MHIAGVIAEYNPFHNGHRHHLEKTREMTGCDGIIVCMSSHFSQRGEAACMDKWTRARIALECGADAVFELPALWAMRTADAFAAGGVHILNRLGTDVLSFGCETEDTKLLFTLAALRDEQPQAFTDLLHRYLEQGMSHVRAYAAAAGEYLKIDAEVLNNPNLILAVEYIRANEKYPRHMQICAVPRIGGYHDPSVGAFASASAIRRAVAAGTADVSAAVPECARAQLSAAAARHETDDLLLWKLRGMSAQALSGIQDVAEGLENRILRAAAQASDRQSLLEALKCRRYTQARLSRILTAAQLDLTKDLAARHALPPYARLIGMRRDASAVVREIKKRAQIQICSDPVALKGNEVFAFEAKATDLWALGRNDACERCAGREFTQKFMLV